MRQLVLLDSVSMHGCTSLAACIVCSIFKLRLHCFVSWLQQGPWPWQLLQQD